MTELKVDIHTHILPKWWPDLTEKYGYNGWITIKHYDEVTYLIKVENKAKMVQDGKVFRDVEANCWCAATRIKECTETNVHVQVSDLIT